MIHFAPKGIIHASFECFRHGPNRQYKGSRAARVVNFGQLPSFKIEGNTKSVHKFATRVDSEDAITNFRQMVCD